MRKYKTSDEMAFSYSVGGKSDKVQTTNTIWTARLLEHAASTATAEIQNTGKSTLFVNLIMEGVPNQGKEIAYQNGLSLVVSYTDAAGRAVEMDRLEQGTNFTAVVTLRNPLSEGIRNVVLTQIFPAGWEILNTRFLHEGALNESTQRAIDYQDIRDDRVHSYIDYLPAGSQLTVRINLCAVYPGKFCLPPVYCEAMYDYLKRANTEGRTVEVY
jgi:uncharacterized protein YfaS (alpha-2-macroglobulin family)